MRKVHPINFTTLLITYEIGESQKQVNLLRKQTEVPERSSGTYYFSLLSMRADRNKKRGCKKRIMIYHDVLFHTLQY